MQSETVGNVTLSFEEPDVLHMTWRKSFGEREVDALLAFTAALRARPDTRLVLYIDVREATGIDARSRKKIVELTKAKAFFASAIVGARVPIRVAVEAIVQAARTMSRTITPTRFFDDDESARTWLAEVRASRSA